VFVLTTIMASASGIGAVPFFFVGRLSVEWSALANAIACGVMLAASFDLVHEGEPYSAWYTIFGVLLGTQLHMLNMTHCQYYNATADDRPSSVIYKLECTIFLVIQHLL
jgi:hypothetical protein